MEIFERIRELDYLLKMRLKELEFLDSLSIKITATYGVEKVSMPYVNKMEDLILNTMELEENIQELVLALLNARKEAIEYLKTLKNENLRDVLYYKFVENLSWGEIAKKTNYSVSHVRNLYANYKKSIVRNS